LSGARTGYLPAMAMGLWRTKSVEQSMQDTEQEGHQLRRNLTAWDLVVFGVAVVVGAGIFTTTAKAAATLAGPAVSVSFVIAAIACGLAAMCYAEFASTVPVAGSAYTFSFATHGELIAWIIGWDLTLELALGAAVVAKGWSEYLSNLFADFHLSLSTTLHAGGFQFDWGSMLVVAVLTVLLVAGTKISARTNMVITIIKVAVVLLVVVVGFTYFKSSNLSPFVPPSQPASDSANGLSQPLLQLVTGGAPSNFGLFGVFAAASLVFFAFIGFDVVATAAEETRKPQRDVPRGIFGSLAIVTVLYVLVTVALSGMVSRQQLAGAPGVDNGKKATLATAFTLVGNGWAATVIAFGALAGLTTVVLVLMLGQNRIIFAMSRDGLLPRGFSTVNKRTGTPVRITVFTGVVVALVSGFLSIDVLQEMVNVGTLSAFVLVSIGVIILRKRRPDLKRSYRVPWVPVIPILAVLACVWLMINLTVETWIRFGVWLVIGFVVYFAYSRRHSVLAEGSKASIEAGAADKRATGEPADDTPAAGRPRRGG
jgi:basic amino acid/polyamine antiporter, APA family